jgi:glycosyltransferase involved in cell wall biosynthesis
MKSNNINYTSLVCVRCMTFNHEAYIKDALNGFVMQQTTFPFVVAIINDASTDKTKSVINEFVENNCIHNPEIDLRIEEYGTVLDVTVKDNPHCIFHIVHLNENHYGKKSKLPYFAKYENAAKYVAMCEGDDYWTDPLKLQKQVDFLEANPEYSMCFHGAEIKNETDTKIITTCQNIEDKEYFTNDIFPGWVVPTASVVYRRLMVNSYPKLSNTKWMYYGDIVLFLKCTHTGRVWGMKEKMSIYRMTYTGAVISAQYDPKVIEKQCNHYRFLMMNFLQLDKKWPSEYIAKYHYTMFRQTKGVLNKLKALCVAFRFSPQIVWQKLTSAFKRL